ncbi:hypothetical protein LV779_34790 [Streptomyces thinghirensis]|nr:hypothetical protein [Streptomyces thinghirensis]
MERPSANLATALTAVGTDDTGDDDEYPPSAQARFAAVDECLNRVRARAEETGEALLDRLYSAALRTLRASGRRGPTCLRYRAVRPSWSGVHPARPLSLSEQPSPAGPHRPHRAGVPHLGWAPAVHTDYLPHALITGFESRGPRVAGVRPEPAA